MGSPARTAPCWTAGYRARTQPSCTTRVKCLTPRPGAWMCTECSIDHPGKTLASFAGCPGRKDPGTPLVAECTASKHDLASAMRRAGGRLGRGLPHRERLPCPGNASRGRCPSKWLTSMLSAPRPRTLKIGAVRANRGGVC